MTQPPIIFDRFAHARQQARAKPSELRPVLEALHGRMVDKLLDMARRFSVIHTVGMADDVLQDALHGAGLKATLQPVQGWQHSETLPLPEASCDAMISMMGLQAVNDLPGMLIQMRRALKPDGLLLVMLPGAESLRELREAMGTAELARSGGMSPRVAPFLEVRDAGALLQRAGFALPVVDAETLSITYPDMFALMRDLRHGGQGNCLKARHQKFTPLGFFAAAADGYATRYGDADGRIPATLELLTLTAWAPHESQQQPAARGSGTVSLVDALQ